MLYKAKYKGGYSNKGTEIMNSQYTIKIQERISTSSNPKL